MECSDISLAVSSVPSLSLEQKMSEGSPPSLVRLECWWARPLFLSRISSLSLGRHCKTLDKKVKDKVQHAIKVVILTCCLYQEMSKTPSKTPRTAAPTPSRANSDCVWHLFKEQYDPCRGDGCGVEEANWYWIRALERECWHVNLKLLKIPL